MNQNIGKTGYLVIKNNVRSDERSTGNPIFSARTGCF